VATKRGKRSGTKATAKRSSKAARPAARPTPAKAAVKPAAKPPAKPAARRAAPVPAAPRREAASAPSLTERALALRDTIQQSKLTAADPWGYTAKARAWQARVERLLDRLGTGAETAETRKAVEALAVEVEGDRDFQEARRLF
jgi:hypothetical protein